MKILDSMQSAKRRVNRLADFRKLGSADITVAFSVGDVHRAVEFDAFSVGPIRTVEDADELQRIGVRIRMTEKQWQFYLRRRKSGKLPSLIGFGLGRSVFVFDSPLDRLKFLRVHQTIQMFVDSWAQHAG